MTSIEFIKQVIDSIENKIREMQCVYGDYVCDTYISMEKHQLQAYQQVLKDLEKLEKIENMRRDWSNGGK